MEYEEDSSFVAKFPEPVTIGSMVTIVGKMNNNIRFDFNLVCIPSGDKALHCRFGLIEWKVVRNHMTRNPGFWGEPEGDGGWPIKESGEFEVAFKIQEDHVEIYVDGKWFVNFLHRLPYSKITHINGTVGADYSSIKFEKSTKSAVKTTP